MKPWPLIFPHLLVLPGALCSQVLRGNLASVTGTAFYLVKACDVRCYLILTVELNSQEYHLTKIKCSVFVLNQSSCHSCCYVSLLLAFNLGHLLHGRNLDFGVFLG